MLHLEFELNVTWWQTSKALIHFKLGSNLANEAKTETQQNRCFLSRKQRQQSVWLHHEMSASRRPQREQKKFADSSAADWKYLFHTVFERFSN